MNDRSKLLIIPDEQILQEVFEIDLKKGINHTSEVQKFLDKYQLFLKFNEDNYQKVSYDIAKLGHMVIKIEEDISLVACYLPKIITDRQYNWFYQNSMILNNYRQISCFSLEMVIDNSTCWKEIYKFQEIMNEIDKKNIRPKEERKR